jgi:acyl-CoA thioester hydrolase
MARDAFRFSFPLRVRWSEVDAQAIVFNPHYLMYFDVAVTDYWRVIGCPYPKAFLGEGVDTFAVKATVEYHRPARFDDMLGVFIRATRIGRTSLRLAFEIYRDPSRPDETPEQHPLYQTDPSSLDEQVVSGEFIYVLATPEKREPTPIPKSLRAAILAYETTPPEET